MQVTRRAHLDHYSYFATSTCNTAIDLFKALQREVKLHTGHTLPDTVLETLWNERDYYAPYRWNSVAMFENIRYEINYGFSEGVYSTSEYMRLVIWF